ncbi:hypothetical protein [Mucilaginibacter sp.]
MKKIIIAAIVVFITGVASLHTKYNSAHVNHATIKITVFGNAKELGSAD